ncbi:DgyrCDS7156 [Dimorphilus gyrociliatus]|uniref:DgyrCDS7156 n=1 Tax=Dimorphilus gyrociliatus TaxID=2664684 RepID=A0A7I8VRV8_9ANNE|nr:DgyrCDS7156 [Dimorphilus gyrociliatus]
MTRPSEREEENPRKQQALERLRDFALEEARGGYPNSRPAWIGPRHTNAVEPHPLTVTHVNQGYILHNADPSTIAKRECQNSSEWLGKHGVESKGLLLKELVSKGKICRPEVSEGNRVQQKISFEAQDIHEFELRLNQAISEYTDRIKWLLQDSRRMFGLLQGRRVAVLLDCSDANCGFGRLTNYQQCLLHLIDDQLSTKDKIYLASFGSTVTPLWPDLVNVNLHTLNEAKAWVNCFEPSGGCNLLKAIKFALNSKTDFDSLLIICGAVPDQPCEVLCSYVSELLIGRQMKIATVAYDCSDQNVMTTLRRISETCDGRYHCYAATCEESIYTGSDISTLLKEIQTAQDVLNKIGEMKKGLLGTALVRVMSEINEEIVKLPQSRLLPQPPGHTDPLCIEGATIQESTSLGWLDRHGLRAQRLDLYQVLAPNAYSYCEQYVPILNKMVQSQVHEKTMAQCNWIDGTIKNVHVDLAQLYDYQKKLGVAVRLYEKRVEWLAKSSRALFGTVVEGIVVICVDLCSLNTPYLVHIQHSLRLLLEQQMNKKKLFNLIVFGSEAKAFQPHVVKPTAQNLQAAWAWLLEQQCSGSRNLLGALRMAFESAREQDHNIQVEGVYVMTSGIPDQPRSVLTSYVQDVCVARYSSVHMILFNVDDYDSSGAIPSRYANITTTADCLRAVAHSSGGRFHWFRETGVIESDDVNLLTNEIDKALNYSRKCAVLVKSVKKKMSAENQAPSSQSLSAPFPRQALPAPSGTSQTSSLTRPRSALKLKKTPILVKKENVREKAKESVNEVQETGRSWLSKHSLKRLKIDLDSLLHSAPDCKHKRHLNAKSRTCSIFPSVTYKGTVRHLQLLPNDLDDYIRKVDKAIKSYARRMQWLLSSSRRIFGVICEKNIVILLDTSGSMIQYVEHLKQAVAALIWEQLARYRINFTIKTFDDEIQTFRSQITSASSENCELAAKWLSGITAKGNTCTLEALEDAYNLKPDSIILLSDGKPDTSTNKIFDFIKLHEKIPIHTVSFACEDDGANHFLNELSKYTSGRYHRAILSDTDAIDLAIHKLTIEDEIETLELPNMDGDDLKLLMKEIDKGQQCIKQAKTFKQLYEKQSEKAEKVK